MSYKLEKPYTEEQYADFVVEYNHNQGLQITETETAVYALEPNEIMGEDGEPIVDPDYGEKQAARRKQIRAEEIKRELEQLDLKTIRALREGGEDESGKTYLETYQERIDLLRQELQTL